MARFKVRQLQTAPDKRNIFEFTSWLNIGSFFSGEDREILKEEVKTYNILARLSPLDSTIIFHLLVVYGYNT
jgi:hypothetical protein